MNELLAMLSGGDLRSDGRANEVAEKVIRKPELLQKLAEGLDESDDVIRGRTADALEKVSRTDPEILQRLLPRLIEMARSDRIPMVRWHIAMMLGSVTLTGKELNLAASTLFHLLSDPSVFVKAWAISSLSLIGRRHPTRREKIIRKIKEYNRDESIAIRTRVRMALDFLNDGNRAVPLAWSKSKEIG